MRVLVTNDDGFESPLLLPLLDELKRAPWCSSLQTLVPAENQSWIAQAHSRKAAIHVSEMRVGTHSVKIINGTPADCTALAIANIFPEPPNIVISGINLGTNAGLGFFFSSGTIGGANMGAIFGLPAIALSADVPRQIFGLWNVRDIAGLGKYCDDWKRIAKAHVALVSRFASKLPHPDVDLISINTPWNVGTDSEVVSTFVEPFHIRSLFSASEADVYRHKLAPIARIDAAPRAALVPDFTAVDEGKISLTTIKYNLGNPLPQGFLD